MTLQYRGDLPEGTELLTGPRGGQYFIRNEERVYLTNHKSARRRSFTPKRGAYARYLKYTSSII